MLLANKRETKARRRSGKAPCGDIAINSFASRPLNNFHKEKVFLLTTHRDFAFWKNFAQITLDNGRVWDVEKHQVGAIKSFRNIKNSLRNFHFQNAVLPPFFLLSLDCDRADKNKSQQRRRKLFSLRGASVDASDDPAFDFPLVIVVEKLYQLLMANRPRVESTLLVSLFTANWV